MQPRPACGFTAGAGRSDIHMHVGVGSLQQTAIRISFQRSYMSSYLQCCKLGSCLCCQRGPACALLLLCPVTSCRRDVWSTDAGDTSTTGNSRHGCRQLWVTLPAGWHTPRCLAFWRQCQRRTQPQCQQAQKQEALKQPYGCRSCLQ